MRPDPDIGRIADELAIRKVVYSYARAVDRLDLELMRSCYHDDAREEHGKFSGSGHDFVATIPAALSAYGCVMHFIGNVLVELEGDVARSEAYCIAFHRTRPDADGNEEDRVTRVRYVDRFERRDGDWRIAHRRTIYDPGRVDPVGERYDPGELAYRSVVGPDSDQPG